MKKVAKAVRKMRVEALRLRKVGYPELGGFLDDLLNVFLRRYRQKNHGLKLFRADLRHSKTFIGFVYKKRLNISPEHFDENLYFAYIRHVNAKGSISLGTLSAYKMFLRSFFRDIEEAGRKVFPWRRVIKCGKRRTPPQLHLSKRQLGTALRRLLAKGNAECVVIAALIALIASTGLRTSEALGLRTKQFFRAGGDWMVRIILKNKERNVPVDPKVKELVDLVTVKFPGDRVFHWISRPTEDGTSFKLEQKISERVHEIIGFPFSLLMLRRYYATHLFDHGCPPEILSILLGHEHFATTLGYVDTSGKRALRFHKKMAKARLKK